MIQNLYEKITLFFILLLTLIFTNIKGNKTLESFEEDKNEVIRKHSIQIYDAFYVNIYKQIIINQIKSRILFEIDDLIKTTQLVKFQKVDILDIGCGIGNHLHELEKHKALTNNKKRYNFTGVDISSAMIIEGSNLIKSDKKGGSVDLLCHDIHDGDLFPQSSFSHIVCYYFTLYSLQIEKIAENVGRWLRNGGYFVVHLCDRDLFDPILDVSNPFVGVSVQKNAKNRQTKSSASFDNLTYTADFESQPNETKVYFHEEFIFKDKKVTRKQTHVLNMIPVQETIDIFEKYKLTHVKTRDLTPIGYHHQYILYFQNS
jgi:SAM-dependent methyltransferase